MNEETALLVIDAQMGVVGEAYHRDEVLENINLLLDRARTSGTPVIYVQHNDPWMEPGMPLWQIHPIPFMRRACRGSWKYAASNAWSSPGARRRCV